MIIDADELGKYKMALQCIAIHGLLIHYTYFHVDFFAVGMFVLWIALVLSVWSGVEYFVKARRLCTGEQRSHAEARDRALTRSGLTCRGGPLKRLLIQPSGERV